MPTDAQTLKIDDRSDLVHLLESFDFPISKDDLVRKAPEIELIWTHNDPISLKDAINVLHGTHFDSLDDLVTAIENALKLAYRDDNFSSHEQIIVS